MGKKTLVDKILVKKEKLTVPKKLKLLITVIEREKVDFYIDVIEEFEVNLQAIVYGRGTVKDSTSHLLGLDSPEKAVIFSIIKEENASASLMTLKEKFTKVKNGNGIAYTIPLTSIIGVMIYQFLTNTQMNIKKGIK